MKLDAIQNVLRCSAEDACLCLEGVVESAGPTDCADMLGLDAVQDCLDSSDKGEVRQFLATETSKASDLDEIKA
eukprot:11967068-Prorocentrum_lima.AAC.1